MAEAESTAEAARSVEAALAGAGLAGWADIAPSAVAGLVSGVRAAADASAADMAAVHEGA